MKTTLIALKQIIQISFSILLLVTLPAIVFTLLTSNTSLIPGMKSFVVLTDSMSPRMPSGSIVYTQKQPSYKVGDVIAFKQGNINITHRVVAVTKESGNTFYQTKGDANNIADSTLVTQSDIFGKSAFRVLNAGKLILFLRTTPGFILLLVVPTLIFISFELFNIKKELEKEIEKKLRRKLAQKSWQGAF